MGQHYLYEEDLKAGDTGAAAVIAAEKEEMAHQQNVKDNEEENKRIAALRAKRLLEESERKKILISESLQQFDVSEAEDGEMEVEFVVGPPVHQEALASDDHEVEENPDAADIDTEYSEFWIENLRKARQLSAFIASEFKK